MAVAVERLDGAAALLRVDGPLDYAATEELDEALRTLLGEGVARLAVDLTAAAPVDDAAVGVLYAALRDVRPLGGELVLALTDRRLLEVLAVMGLDRRFRLVETPAAAAAAITAPAASSA